MQEQELKKEVEAIDSQTKYLIINSRETFERAGSIILLLDNTIKKIKEYWKEPKEKAFQAHKSITAKESEMLKPIEDRKKHLKYSINSYATEQERIRQEQQRKIDEERRKKEEAERLKLERAAQKAEEKGKDQKAEELREKAENVYIPPTIVVPEIEKTTKTDAGTISQQKDLKVKIFDMRQLLQEILSGTIPISLITINEPKLKQFIKDQGIKNLCGCEIKEVIITLFRGK